MGSELHAVLPNTLASPSGTRSRPISNDDYRAALEAAAKVLRRGIQHAHQRGRTCCAQTLNNDLDNLRALAPANTENAADNRSVGDRDADQVTAAAPGSTETSTLPSPGAPAPANTGDEALTQDELALAATGAQLAIAWWKKAEGNKTKYAKDEIAKYTRLIEKIDGPLLRASERGE